MIYLIAVKLKDGRDVQIYEFKTEKERLIYAESIRHLNDVEDIAYSQIEKE